MKQFIIELAVFSAIAFSAIMIAGPSAGVDSLAYKVSMHIYMGNKC